MNSLRRRVMTSKNGGSGIEGAVDLGLPSGILWHEKNLEAQSWEYYGAYFAWGDITGYKSGHAFSESNYNSTRVNGALIKNISTDLPLTNDAANYTLEEAWRMPSASEFSELFSNCTKEWEDNGISKGIRFTSNINGNSIFIPAAGGFFNGNATKSGATTNVDYWTKTYISASGARMIRTGSNAVYSAENKARYIGAPIRPVRYPAMEYVDLGLPSGLKWATCNLGASTPEKAGLYFSWGNVVGHPASEGYNFNDTNYNSTPGAGLSGDIPVNGTYDAAQYMLGGKWRMPSNSDFQELYNNTDRQYVSNFNGTGIAGWKFKKKNAGDNPPFIFIPMSKYFNNSSSLGSNTFYWAKNGNGTTYSYSTQFTTSAVTTAYSWTERRIGMCIRPVYDPSL